ncbi:MAG: Ni/Fe hydrogenase subunit alpha [Magnetococcales bacterium]|nr:Ni/Fe hydrogenase subunit alpha [Magnetococcales bacterium]
MTTITINHLSRVEGHGGIHVTVGPDGVERCEMEIFEGSRFYEALLLGRHFEEVPGTISRVCAICSSGHTLCALGAIEDALDITVTPQVQSFRDLLNLGQFIESHALHLFCLAVPDYLGYSGVLEMAQYQPDVVGKALELKRIGNAIQELIGGRAIHPVNMTIGGMGRIPTAESLTALAGQLAEGLESALALERFIIELPIPDCHLDQAVYVALQPDGSNYALHGGMLAASGHDPIPVANFRQRVHESVVSHSTAKQSLYSDKPFMVGAVARMVLNGERMSGVAAQTRNRIIPDRPTPMHNNPAQFVELVWALSEGEKLAHDLSLATPESPVNTQVKAKKSAGQQALEVPRGTLYHAYGLNADGLLCDADIITPTAQNLANIEKDFATTASCWLHHAQNDEARLKHGLEMVARAYDPCISCATHLVDLTMRKESS